MEPIKGTKPVKWIGEDATLSPNQPRTEDTWLRQANCGQVFSVAFYLGVGGYTKTPTLTLPSENFHRQQIDISINLIK